MKKRLDVFLVENNFFETRIKAQTEIKNGKVLVDGKVAKPSLLVDDKSVIKVLDDTLKYVSRAGLKLEKAKQEFDLDFVDKVVLDIGSSTGGFTDFCLKNGAKKVYAVDVGTNQLHKDLRQNKKVVLMEQTDIRNTNPKDFCDVDIAVCDVSFISLTKICNSVKEILGKNKPLVALIKPQFECGKEIAKKYKGVIKDPKIHNQVIESVVKYFKANGFSLLQICQSPIKGGDGNLEFLSYFVTNHSLN